KEVAHRVGLGEYWDARVAPALPLLLVVQQPTPYNVFTTGARIESNEFDILCRAYATGSTHQALPTTATACLGAACRIEGSIPFLHLSSRAATRDLIEVGHPSGIIRVESQI